MQEHRIQGKQNHSNAASVGALVYEYWFYNRGEQTSRGLTNR